MSIVAAFRFSHAQTLLHTGARQWPRTKLFEMHAGYTHCLLAQTVAQEAVGQTGVSLRQALTLSGFGGSIAASNTCVQLWSPFALLAVHGRWKDVSIPASFSWSSSCSALRDVGTKRAIDQGKTVAMALQHGAGVSCKAPTDGVEPLGPAGFHSLADDIAQWAEMLLRGQAFEAVAEQTRFEIVLQTLRSQATLLESMAAGETLEAIEGRGHKRFNIIFLLQNLWFAYNLRSDHVLRDALLNAVRVLYPKTRHGFLEQIISDESLPLPSRSILVQARFFLDVALMKRMRAIHADRFGADKPSSALYLLVDSSPQGGFNWMMAQYVWISHECLVDVAAKGSRLTCHALQLRAMQDEALPLSEEDAQSEAELARTVSQSIHRHPLPPVAARFCPGRCVA